jgi:hypothetical protein
MAKLDIGNVIRVTLLSALKGLSDVNTSALALFVDEVPIPADYGDYQIYLSPDAVADDFGSSSDAYRLAVMAFSSSPNIMSGGGYLVIIPKNQTAAASAATIIGTGPVDLTALGATDYKIKAAIDGAAAAEISIGAIDATSMATAAASLNSYDIETAGLVFEITGELTAATVTLKSDTAGATSAIVLSACSTGTDIAIPLKIALQSATGAAAGVERLKDAVLRTRELVDYFGIIANEKLATDALLLEFAQAVQTMDKLYFAPSSVSGDITAGFASIMNAGLTHTRCLYYSVSADDALDFAAGYAGRGLSINFSGFNTAHTMHLKEITGMEADTGITQTVLNTAKNNGVDVLANIGGVTKVMTSGENQYFDQVYTRLAFKLRLAVSGFNFLASTNTKIPQTEEGMNGLKGAFRKVCGQFVDNGVFAPGAWISATTFGTPEDHIRNIKDAGYFIYSQPIASQSQTDRNARKAPAVSIAAKDAGAIHSADVTVYVEA